MDESKGKTWMLVAIVNIVLLVLVLALVIILAVASGNRKSEDAARIGELETELELLGEEKAALEAEKAALEAKIAALEQQLQAIQTGGSTGGSGGSGGGNTTSDKQQVESMALNKAKSEAPGINWKVASSKIVGDWARVDIIDPNHQAEGASFYFHKVGGKWTLVDYGTGIEAGDIPGAPPELFK